MPTLKSKFCAESQAVLIREFIGGEWRAIIGYRDNLEYTLEWLHSLRTELSK